MNNTREYTTIGELIVEPEFGFVIFHQEPALGNDFRDKETQYSEIEARLKSNADNAISQLRDVLGDPTSMSAGWDIGVPTWASGGGYAIWRRENDFISSFISWDNPEDPSFVIVGRASIEDYSDNHINPNPDPWMSEWMHKGVW